MTYEDGEKAAKLDWDNGLMPRPLGRAYPRCYRDGYSDMLFRLNGSKKSW
jgi:hypothetical protein